MWSSQKWNLSGVRLCKLGTSFPVLHVIVVSLCWLCKPGIVSGTLRVTFVDRCRRHPVVLVFAGCQVKTWPVVTVHVYTPNSNSTISILRFFWTLISADEISECVTVVCIHYSCDQYTDRISFSEGEVCAGSARCCAHGEVI